MLHNLPVKNTPAIQGALPLAPLPHLQTYAQAIKCENERIYDSVLATRRGSHALH